MTITKMSWHPQYRSSKFRHVYGKPANKENCYDGVPITKSVHDNHFCAVNPCFIAVITECAGGGAFLVIPISQTGKIDPHHPRICGHKGNVLDIKWNPFDDYSIASCSEDAIVKVWEIPKHGLLKNTMVPQKELQGHSRRVGLIEWHPTAGNVLFSASYDYKIMIWNLDCPESVIKNPVKTIGLHDDVILSMSFNTDGRLLATSCKDKKIRVIDPRLGVTLQETYCKTHKATKVLFLGNMKMLITTGTSRYNNRQVTLWDQEDLSVPLMQEDLDCSSGVLFPFYDPDTHMLYIAGKGDGYIRYYEISSEKPYLHFLTEYRSYLPQKGLGIMPKRGLEVSSCEVFRFYKLVTIKSLIEPVSMIVPRRSESYQEDIYPMTAGCEPALSADEWIQGANKDPVLMSLKPGSKISKTCPLITEKEPIIPLQPKSSQSHTGRTEVPSVLPNKESKDSRERRRLDERPPERSRLAYSNGIDLTECAPPKTENELLQMFYRQQEEIRRLRELLGQREIWIKQLELEIKNVRNSPY
ncbi:coronin-2A isoform X2 [Erpetoichthys calabaricus]|uniref:Coronin n=1 Tax=Erpetoichthys calabaricus TaxID=27687 RepID=A0A8C4TJ35_ERPCA|nr:coronin-2A isoform X2 [Erpetoichthys calabaricus]